MGIKKINCPCICFTLTDVFVSEQHQTKSALSTFDPLQQVMQLSLSPMCPGNIRDRQMENLMSPEFFSLLPVWSWYIQRF